MRLYDAPYLLLLQQRLAAAKQRSYDLLAAKPGQLVVDVGCGIGLDAAALAGNGATVVGLDTNESLLTEARDKFGAMVAFHCRSAQETGLASASVDALRFDRVLQHITPHDAVLTEAHRVLRPGGRLQVVDTDWLSTSLFLPDPALELRLVESFALKHCPGAALLRQLPQVMRQHGFVDVTMEVHSVLTEDFANADSAVHRMVAQEMLDGCLTEHEQATWAGWKAASSCWLSQHILIFQAIRG